MKWLKLLAGYGANIQRQVLWLCKVIEAVGGNWGQNPTDKSCSYMKWLKLLAANGAKIQQTGLVAI
jgi:hypothetical protein